MTVDEARAFLGEEVMKSIDDIAAAIRRAIPDYDVELSFLPSPDAAGEQGGAEP